MPAIRGAIGFNPSSGTARLFAAYGYEIINLATGTSYPALTDNANDVEFEKFLDRVFFQNNVSRPLTYNTSTNLWTNEHVGRAPRSKYIKKYKSRLYLGYCQFTDPQIPTDTDGNELTFASRVFYSDLFSAGTRGVSGPDLTWGLEWGRNGLVQPRTGTFYLQTQGLNYFLNQDFKVRNIKVGDPITMISTDTPDAYGELLKTHLVTSIDSVYRLTLNTTFTTISNGALINYWVGSNWFDVSPDDGDVITGFGENSDSILIFKLYTLWLYTRLESSATLRQVPGAVGTSYNRSIINDRYGNTYYFHGSDPKVTGIYKYSRGSSIKISKAIDKDILGMSSDNYDNVVAWAEGNEIRFFLGDLSATNYIEAMTNAVATYNVDTDAWSVDPIADVITAMTTWRTGNEEDTYLGTSDDEVLKADDGNSFNTANIRSRLETKVYYPAGTEVVNQFPYIQVVARNAKGVRLKYRLWDIPTNSRYSIVDSDYTSLGEIEGDLTEFILPTNHYTASGIQFFFDELSTVENDWYIEKISIFYKPERGRLG